MNHIKIYKELSNLNTVKISFEPLRIKIDLMTYEIEFELFIVLDKEVYDDYLHFTAL